MMAIAYFKGGHTAVLQLDPGTVAALEAPFGSHQTIAEELRESHGALRVSISHQGMPVAESRGGEGTKIIELIDASLARIHSGGAPMRIPVDPTDADVVLGECRAHIMVLENQLEELRRAADDVLQHFDAGADGEAELEVGIDMLREQLRLLADGV